MKVNIKPSVLEWAINYSQRHIADVEAKFPKIREWLAGDAELSMSQIKSFAKFTWVPVGYLFLSKPPQNIFQDMPDFRTIDLQKPNQISVNLVESINIIKRRQDWLSDYRKLEDYDRLRFVGAYRHMDLNMMVSKSYKLLNLESSWQCSLKSKEESFGYLIQKLEDIGISVFVNGVVGNNTHRPLNVEEFRGFTLIDDYAPIIFINGADTSAAKLFTLVHEFCHILLGEEGISGNMDNEEFCNSFAANFLVPKSAFISAWNTYKEDYRKIGNFFKVSDLTVYRIAYTYKLISYDKYKYLTDLFYKFFYAQMKKKKTGGDYYNTAKYRVSTSFGMTVAKAVKNGNLLYGEAYDLLGVRAKTYDRLIKTLELNSVGGI